MMLKVDKLKRLSEQSWFYPLFLLLMGFVTYNYVLTSLGYYWSDWEVVMFNKLPHSLQFGYFAEDRPFPWTYQLIYFLVGPRPIGWHIVTLLIRWAGTLFFVNALICFWPHYKKQFFWLGALLIVYPGFLQQTQSAAKARHIMTLLLFTLSLYLMALAIRRPKLARLFYPLSWIVTFLHLFTTEYFSGVELLRPILIWLLVKESNQMDFRSLRKVAVTYLPYLLVTIFFFWGRFVYFPSTFQTMSRIGNINSTLGGFKDTFVESFLGLFNRAFLDLIYSTLQVWINGILRLSGFSFQQRITWFAFGVGALFAFVFSFFYNTNVNENEDKEAEHSSPVLILFIGFLFFVMSALPVWAIGRDFSSGGWNDRYALAPMLGASLMAVGLVLIFVRPVGQKWVFGFLLMFSIATQIWVVNDHRRDWKAQLDYYWQFYWRMPALQAGTTLYSYGAPSRYVPDDADVTWVINVLYNYQAQNVSLPYLFVTPERQVYLQPDTTIVMPARNLIFNGNTSDVVVIIHQTDTSCLRVLDTVYLHDPIVDEGSEKLIPFSHLSRIIPDPVPVLPDKNIFGSEPTHTWCYFFEKADLARQIQDWDQIIDLYNQAQASGYSPEYGAEYLPFIEAYAQTGDWQKAYDLTIIARHRSLGTLKMLCSNWARLGTLPSANMEIVEQVYQVFSC